LTKKKNNSTKKKPVHEFFNLSNKFYTNCPQSERVDTRCQLHPPEFLYFFTNRKRKRSENKNEKKTCKIRNSFAYEIIIHRYAPGNFLNQLGEMYYVFPVVECMQFLCIFVFEEQTKIKRTNLASASLRKRRVIFIPQHSEPIYRHNKWHIEFFEVGN